MKIAVTHKKTTKYIDETFRAALEVQSAGLKDGYLISVIYDMDDTTEYEGDGWIFCGALVNGQYYMWSPEETVTYIVPDFVR